MSLLTIVRRVCARVGIASPTTVVGSDDRLMRRMLELANEEGEELAARPPGWQILIREGSFLSKAQEDQGAIAALAPGYASILNDTLWESNRRMPIFGSAGAARWQLSHARQWTGPMFRIRGGRLLISPILSAGLTVTFEYQSRAWATSADGSTLRTYWQSDDDVALLDEALMAAGLLWRWKQALGLEYAEDFAKYERRVADATTRDVPAGVVSMADPYYSTDSRYAFAGISITEAAETPPETPPGDGGGGGGTPTYPEGTLFADFSVKMATPTPATQDDNNLVTLAMLKAYLGVV